MFITFLFKMLYCIFAFICFSYALASADINSYPSGRIDDTHMHKHLNYKTKTPNALFNKLEENREFWNEQAKATIKDQLKRKINTGKAKNVILFLGDGMSLSTLAAARVYLGRKHNKTGEEMQLSFEKFPHLGLSKTYCVDKQVPDSACTATAYLCGVKGNYKTIGVTAAVKQQDCDGMRNTSNHAYSIAKKFQIDGRRTGFVTTARVTHASPAGVYAQTAFRHWESDTDMIQNEVDPTVCHDTAYQLVHGEVGQNLNVILGGGRKNFFPKTENDPEGIPGHRSDGQDLIKKWKILKKNTAHAYVTDRRELLKLSNETEYVFGLFDTDHMEDNLDRNVTTKPSLEEMTVKAINLLSESKKGYFLFVEGARIDMGHHYSLARKALDETIEFHKAIETAVRITNSEDTLIVVTADHSHTFTMSGYPDRGSDVLGIAGISDMDYLPYTTGGYSTGPGYRKEENGIRHDVSKDDLENKNYAYPGMVPRDKATHGAEDAAIFSQGPWAHLLNSLIEQHVIPHVIAFAACLSDFNACNM